MIFFRICTSAVLPTNPTIPDPSFYAYFSVERNLALLTRAWKVHTRASNCDISSSRIQTPYSGYMPGAVLNTRSIQLRRLFPPAQMRKLFLPQPLLPAAGRRVPPRQLSPRSPAPSGAPGAGAPLTGRRMPAARLPPLTLDFPEGADAQRVPQDVVPDLHPPVLVLLFIRHRRHLEARAEPAHSARPGRAGAPAGGANTERPPAPEPGSERRADRAPALPQDGPLRLSGGPGRPTGARGRTGPTALPRCEMAARAGRPVGSGGAASLPSQNRPSRSVLPITLD